MGGQYEAGGVDPESTSVPVQRAFYRGLLWYSLGHPLLEEHSHPNHFPLHRGCMYLVFFPPPFHHLTWSGGLLQMRKNIFCKWNSAPSLTENNSFRFIMTFCYATSLFIMLYSLALPVIDRHPCDLYCFDMLVLCVNLLSENLFYFISGWRSKSYHH